MDCNRSSEKFRTFSCEQLKQHRSQRYIGTRSRCIHISAGAVPLPFICCVVKGAAGNVRPGSFALFRSFPVDCFSNGTEELRHLPRPSLYLLIYGYHCTDRTNFSNNTMSHSPRSALLRCVTTLPQPCHSIRHTEAPRHSELPALPAYSLEHVCSMMVNRTTAPFPYKDS
jgi:hypothetical protein